MLVVKEDKKRDVSEGQIFIELVDYPDIPNMKRCNRLSYWCDKGHLNHFIIKLTELFTKEELEEILNCKIIKR